MILQIDGSVIAWLIELQYEKTIIVYFVNMKHSQLQKLFYFSAIWTPSNIFTFLFSFIYFLDPIAILSAPKS